VMHRHEPAILLVPFEQRKIHHPHERVLIRLHQSELAPQREAQLSEQLRRRIRGTGGEEQQVVRSGTTGLQSRGERAFPGRFERRTLQRAFGTTPHPHEPRGAELPRLLSQFVELSP
jgi:hypothetical protein